MIKIPITELQRLVTDRVVKENIATMDIPLLMDAVRDCLAEVNAWVLDSGGDIVAARFWGGSKGGKTEGYYLMPDEMAVLFKLRYG